jgi:stalled ribosome rescue protein Dom34
MSKHVAIWIDHKEAHIFHIHSGDPETVIVTAALHAIHHKPQQGPKEPWGHPDDDIRFFAEIARSLPSADEILVVGPSSAKLEFVRYLAKREPDVESAVVGVETVDHPTDGQLVAFAKQYFQRTDRML